MKKRKQNTGRKRCKGGFWKGLVLFLLVVAFALVGNYLANGQIYITEYEVAEESLPEAFDGYRIVQVTDIHSIRSLEQADTLYQKIEEQNPDAIVLTGDILDSEHYTQENNALKAGTTDKMAGQDTLNFIKRLTEHYYVYFVYGNHEMVLLDDVDNNPFKVAMEEIGVIFLNNDGVKISKDDESIYLLGIQDPATLYKDRDYAECENHTERMHAMLKNTTALMEEDLYTILLSHRPEYLEVYAQYDLDLVLTGHAHGGQVRILGVGGLYAPGQGAFPEYTEGIWEQDGTTMIIGRGLGNAVKVPRIFNPPELNTIILKRTSDGTDNE